MVRGFGFDVSVLEASNPKNLGASKTDLYHFFEYREISKFPRIGRFMGTEHTLLFGISSFSPYQGEMQKAEGVSIFGTSIDNLYLVLPLGKGNQDSSLTIYPLERNQLSVSVNSFAQ